MKGIMYYQLKGQGKPILLIHGWTMDSRVWKYFIREFATQYQVLTIDLRGHGKSSSLPGPYNFKTFADDIVTLIRSLKLRQVTLVGWSMGVSVILKIFEHRVPFVDSLVFICGTPSLIVRDGYSYGLSRSEAKRFLSQIKKDYTSGMQNFYSLLFLEAGLNRKQEEKIYPLVANLSGIPRPEVALESLRCLHEEDLRPSLKNIAVPTLLIHGDLDRICIPDASRYMQQEISNAHLHIVKDTGHFPFLAERAEVHRMIKKFLQAL